MTQRIRATSCVAALLFSIPVLASAQESNAPRLAPTDDAFTAEYRTRGIALSEFPLDATGETLGQSAYAEHRLRVGGFVKNGPISMTADADLSNGLLFGDTSSRFPYLGYRRDNFGGLADPSTFFVRQLSIEARTPVAVVRAGHMTSKWGLGLVANDGNGTPDWGDHYLADVVERAVVATRPLARANPALAPLLIAAGGDLVFRDQTADLVKGDRAYQGIATIVWAPEGSVSRAGVYGVRRSQVDRDGFELNAWILDAHGRLQTDLGAASLHLEGEIVRVWGETDIVRDIYQDTRTIDQMGAAFEIGAGIGSPVEGQTSGARRFEAVLQTGYASGDDRAQDGRLSAFKFDPEYNVGFILFEEVLAWQSAATARNVSDPDSFGRPAAGARFLPTEGSVTNARYLMPTVRIHPIAPVTVRAAVLLAQADRPLDDAFQTNAQNGGVRHNALGSTTASRDLGMEIDLGARYLWDRAKAPSVAADLQLGRFIPGAAFEDASGEKMDPVDRLLAGVTLFW